MDLWNSFKGTGVKTFGESILTLNTGPRQHTSLSMVEKTSVELKPNKWMFRKYSESERYIIAKDISFDMLLVVYDVNTRSTLAARASMPLDREALGKIGSALGHMRGGNLELRAIGLQTGHTDVAASLDRIHSMAPMHMMETDLFGIDVRHIALDTKTGMPYNILLLNKIYRAGELACQINANDFNSKYAATTTMA